MLASCRAAVVLTVNDFQTFLLHNPASTVCLYGQPRDILGCISIADEPDRTLNKVFTWTQARKLTVLQPILQDVLKRPLVRGPVVWLRSPLSVAIGVEWDNDFGMCAVLVVELRVRIAG